MPEDPKSPPDSTSGAPVVESDSQGALDQLLPVRSTSELKQLVSRSQPSQPVSPYSVEWAKYARPFAYFAFAMPSAVIVLGYGAILSIDGLTATERLDAITGWSTAVLPASVAVVSSAVGYIFGSTRSQ